MLKSMLSLPIACLALAIPTATAGAGVIVEHLGNADPVSESPVAWTRTAGGSGAPTPGPAGHELQAGPPAAIRVYDEATNRSIYYIYTTTADQRTEAATKGWKLSANLKVNDANDTIGDAGISVEYMVTGGVWYRMEWGSNAQGEAIVGLHLGSGAAVTHTLVGSNTSQFHLYELIYDPVANNADLFVDGTEVVSNLNPRSGVANRVIFGSLSNAALGDASYNLVRFEALPEPASLSLLVLGGLLASPWSRTARP